MYHEKRTSISTRMSLHVHEPLANISSHSCTRKVHSVSTRMSLHDTSCTWAIRKHINSCTRKVHSVSTRMSLHVHEPEGNISTHVPRKVHNVSTRMLLLTILKNLSWLTFKDRGFSLPRLPHAVQCWVEAGDNRGCAAWSWILETPDEKWIKSQVNKMSIMKKGWKRVIHKNTQTQTSKGPKQGKKVDPNVRCSVRWNQHLRAAYLLGHPVFLFSAVCVLSSWRCYILHILYSHEGQAMSCDVLCYMWSELKL